MKKIAEIYSKYKIPPNLQEHQLRVAAVANQICDSLWVPVDTGGVVITCLLHDMGNIIKFDLRKFPQFIEESSIPYWEGIKEEYIEKYGNDEHTATLGIAKEIGISRGALSCLKKVGFSKAIDNAKSNIIEYKICSYSDMRVGPFGVLSLSERISEGQTRYKNTNRSHIFADKYNKIVESLIKVEDQIFENSNIRPNQITDESIRQYLNNLTEFALKD
jgi:hypothetical protein